jgi:hypothetical protein
MKMFVFFICFLALPFGCKSVGGRAGIKSEADETLATNYYLWCDLKYLKNSKVVDNKKYRVTDAKPDQNGWYRHDVDWSDSATGISYIGHGFSKREIEDKGQGSWEAKRQYADFKFLKVTMPDGRSAEIEYDKGDEGATNYFYPEVNRGSVTISKTKFVTPQGAADEVDVDCELTSASGG